MDTRQALRFPLEESIAATWMDNGRPRRAVGETRDISTRGVFFYLDFPIANGTHVELRLEFPTKVTALRSSPVFCRGCVVRLEPLALVSRFGVAVEIESYADLAPVA